MRSLASSVNLSGFDRVVLQIDEGVDVFAFESETSSNPKWDYFLDDIEQAKAFCLERWGVPLQSWISCDEQPNLY